MLQRSVHGRKVRDDEAMGWEFCIRHGNLDLNVQFLFQISNSFFTVHDSLWWTLYRCVFSNGGKAWDEWAVGVLYQSFLISSKINTFFLSIVHVLHIAEVYLTNILPPVLVTFPFGFTLKYTKYTKYTNYTKYKYTKKKKYMHLVNMPPSLHFV